MPRYKNPYGVGRNREWDYRDKMTTEGWTVFRSAGSHDHGIGDLIMFKAGCATRIVSSKKTITAMDMGGQYAFENALPGTELWIVERRGERWVELLVKVIGSPEHSVQDMFIFDEMLRKARGEADAETEVKT